MKTLPKIALGAWAWGNDGTFGNNLTAQIPAASKEKHVWSTGDQKIGR